MLKILVTIIISFSLLFISGCTKEEKFCWSCYIFATPQSYTKEYCDKTEEEMNIIRAEFNEVLPTDAIMLECNKK